MHTYVSRTSSVFEKCTYETYTGFIRGILRGVRYAKSLIVLFLHRRSPSWTTLVLYSRVVFIFNEPTITCSVHAKSRRHTYRNTHWILNFNGVLHRERTVGQTQTVLSCGRFLKKIRAICSAWPGLIWGSGNGSYSSNIEQVGLTRALLFVPTCISSENQWVRGSFLLINSSQ